MFEESCNSALHSARCFRQMLGVVSGLDALISSAGVGEPSGRRPVLSSKQDFEHRVFGDSVSAQSRVPRISG
jgi:hypothetical protein